MILNTLRNEIITFETIWYNLRIRSSRICFYRIHNPIYPFKEINCSSNCPICCTIKAFPIQIWIPTFYFDIYPIWTFSMLSKVYKAWSNFWLYRFNISVFSTKQWYQEEQKAVWFIHIEIGVNKPLKKAIESYVYTHT